MTNKQLRKLLQDFADRFGCKFLPKGDPSRDILPCSVVDQDASLLFITKNGKGVGLMAADCDCGVWVRVRPGGVKKAIREGNDRYGNRRWGT